MNEILIYLVTVPVAVLFLAFVLGGGIMLPIWEYLDTRDSRRRSRDPGAEVIPLRTQEEDATKERAAA